MFMDVFLHLLSKFGRVWEQLEFVSGPSLICIDLDTSRGNLNSVSCLHVVHGFRRFDLAKRTYPERATRVMRCILLGSMIDHYSYKVFNFYEFVGEF